MNSEKQQIDLPVILGKVIGHFGVQGWVKIFSYTKPKQAILEYKEMALKEKNHWKTLKIEEGRVHGKNVLIKIRNIENRERAEQARQTNGLAPTAAAAFSDRLATMRLW